MPPTAPARLYCAAESARSADDIVSKQDTHFINVFSMVIALLVAFAVGIFIFARIVASHTQDRQLLSEAAYGKRVAARIAPPGAVAVAGQDNTALAIKSDSPAQAAGTAAGGHSGGGYATAVSNGHKNLWGGFILLKNGWRIALPDLSQNRRLPVTVDARRLSS